MKKITTLSLVVVFLSLIITSISLFSASAEEAQSQEISEKLKKNLSVIADRTDVQRLEYNKRSDTWQTFESSYYKSFERFVTFKSRFDVIEPLEELVKKIQIEINPSVSKEKAAFNYRLIRRAYTSLSMLYSFYKLYPAGSKSKQAEFILKFSNVLKEFHNHLTLIENHHEINITELYKDVPWGFADAGPDDEHNLGLHYIDMPVDKLNEIFGTGIHNKVVSAYRAMLFIPREEQKPLFRSELKEENDHRNIVMFWVHGTVDAAVITPLQRAGLTGKEYHSEDDILFRQVKYMAQVVSNQTKARVELISIKWPGGNTQNDRLQSGAELANIVQTYYPEAFYKDIYLAHSHGGNVLFQAANAMRYKRVPYLVATFGTPIRTDNFSDNLNWGFFFHTPSDMVQYGGSYQVSPTSAAAAAFGASINPVGTAIALAANSSSQNPRKLSREDIRKQGLFKNNAQYSKIKLFNIHVKINGKEISTGYLRSHTDVKTITAILPRILETIVLEYRPNRDLVLNVDRKVEDLENPRIREIESAKFQIAASKSEKDLLEEEVVFSKNESDEFFKLHKSNIQ